MPFIVRNNGRRRNTVRQTDFAVPPWRNVQSHSLPSSDKELHTDTWKQLED
jgi:hypothetical protein